VVTSIARGRRGSDSKYARKRSGVVWWSEKCSAGADIRAGRERERRDNHGALNEGCDTASSVFAHERDRVQLSIPAVFVIPEAGRRGLIVMCASGGRPLNRVTPDPANQGGLLPNGDGQHD